MAVSESRKKAAQAYMKKNCISKLVRFNKNNERDVRLLSHLEAQDNQTEYLKDLIEDDMIRR